MKNKYYLECEYDTRTSFYKKAYVEEIESSRVLTKELISYDTLVANYVNYKGDREVFEYFGKYSQTTTRHQKEFFRQLGLSEKEIKQLFKNGKLVKMEVE